MVLFFLSPTPLDYNEEGGITSCVISFCSQNSLKGLDSYSLPLSVLSLLIFYSFDSQLQFCTL
jgi:hypothetical protein